MKSVVRRARTAVLGAIAGLAVGVFSAQAETNWDMSVVWPDGNFHTKNAKKFAEMVREATGGKVVITVHAGGALGIKGPEGTRVREASALREAA